MNYRRHILFVSQYSGLMGSNLSLLNTISCLKDYGYECSVLLPFNGPIEEKLQELKTSYLITNYFWWKSSQPNQNVSLSILRYWNYKIFKFFINIKVAASLIRFVREKGINLIYTNSSYTPLGILLSLFTGIKHIWHLREYGDLDYNQHDDFGKRFSHFFYKKSNRIIFISEAQKIYYELAGKLNNSSLIYNGFLNHKSLEAIPDKKFYLNGKLTLLTIGDLSINKGQINTIRFLRKLVSVYHNQVQFIFVGPGDPTLLIKEARDIGLASHVFHVPYTPNVELYYNMSDVFVMSSVNEAFGRVTIEAMAHGLPIMAFGGGANKELVDDGVEGYIYNNETEFCEKFKLLVSDKMFTIGLAGKEKVKNKFSYELYRQRIISTINEVYS